MSKATTYWIDDFLSAYNMNPDRDDTVEVVEKSAYNEAIKALKAIETDENFLKLREGSLKRTGIINWTQSGASHAWLLGWSYQADKARKVLEDLKELDGRD